MSRSKPPILSGVKGSGFWVLGSGFRVLGSGLEGSGFIGLGLRPSGFDPTGRVQGSAQPLA